MYCQVSPLVFEYGNRRGEELPREGWNSSLSEAKNLALQRGKIVTNPECILYSLRAIFERSDGRNLHSEMSGKV
jgi:hypothetical protein